MNKQQQAAIKIQRAYKKFINRAFTRHKAAKKIQKNYKKHLSVTRRRTGFRARVERIRKINKESPFYKANKGFIWDESPDARMPIFPVNRNKLIYTAGVIVLD
jgi:hypothetical protein